MLRACWRRRVAAVASAGAIIVAGCGSDRAEEPQATASPLVDELLVVLRASTDAAALPEFDAAQTCLRETFGGYTDADLQALVGGIGTRDLSGISDELRERLRDDALGCNEQNRALDPADYKADAEQRIADSGVTSVRCELPADTSVGAKFRCTGNVRNRTSEYEVTIDTVGHVVIERTD